MKFTIACVLLFAVAAQTQFIGGYTGYPLLPAATSVQWLHQGQPALSVLSPVYPSQGVYYRSLDEITEPETSSVTQRKSVDAAPSRIKRQIQLRYGGRRGRSLEEITEPDTSSLTQRNSVDAALSRTKRQIQLRYGGRRGRSVSEIIDPTGTDYENVDAAASNTKYQTQLQYGGNRPGRSLNEPQPVLRAYPVQFDVNPARKQRQIQLRYRGSSRRRHGRSLDTPWSTA